MLGNPGNVEKNSITSVSLPTDLRFAPKRSSLPRPELNHGQSTRSKHHAQSSRRSETVTPQARRIDERLTEDNPDKTESSTADNESRGKGSRSKDTFQAHVLRIAAS
jgi:hypothetical protein